MPRRKTAPRIDDRGFFKSLIVTYEAGDAAVETLSRPHVISYLKETLRVLEAVGCLFQFCDGPDEPFVSMKTCKACYHVQLTRAILEKLRRK